MSDITEILREFNIPLLVASENGPTNAEIAMAEEVARLRARVEVLERVRAAAQALIDYEDAGPDAPGGLCWMRWEEKFQAMRDALKETAP